MNRQSLVAVSVVAILIAIGISILIASGLVFGPEATSSGTMAPVRPTSTAPIRQTEPVAIYSAVLHHLFRDPQGTPGRERWFAIYLNPTLSLATDVLYGTPTPDPPLPVPHGLVAALTDLAPHVQLKPRREFGGQMPWYTISVSLGPINQSGDGATVGVDWFLSGTGGAGYEYRLIQEGGAWQVIEAKMLWIS